MATTEKLVPQVFDRALLQVRRARALAQWSAGRSAGADFLLRRTMDDLADRMALMQRRFEQVVVLGAHVAEAIEPISKLHNVRRVEAADALGGDCTAIDEEVCGRLLPREALDAIVSPLVLQWVNDLPGALVQMRQALKPDGLLLVGMIGGATLTELRQALMAAESEIEGGASPRVAPFCDVRDLGGLLQRAGLALPVTDTDTVDVAYPHILALMHDLRAMGATNVLVDRRRGPMKRATLLRAGEIYQERFGRPDGKIRATFEILTATAWAPSETQQKPLKPGSAAQRLKDALGAKDEA